MPAHQFCTFYLDKLLFGVELNPRSSDVSPMNVVVRSEDGAVSFLVDEIGDVVEVEDSSFEPAPEMLRASIRSMILGVHKLNDRLMHVLDTEKACEMIAAAETVPTA